MSLVMDQSNPNTEKNGQGRNELWVCSLIQVGKLLAKSVGRKQVDLCLVELLKLGPFSVRFPSTQSKRKDIH